MDEKSRLPKNLERVMYLPFNKMIGRLVMM